MNLKIIAALTLIFMFSGAYYAGFSAGVDSCNAKTGEKKDKAEEEDKKDVKTVIKWREKEKKVYVDKIKYIKTAKDPTGCADTKLTDMGFGMLK